MFNEATSFNRNLCSLLEYDNFPSNVNTRNMFTASGCDILDDPSPSVVCNYCPFKTRNELKNAVDLWTFNQGSAKDKYGHINNWDVSQVKDFNVSLFVFNFLIIIYCYL